MDATRRSAREMAVLEANAVAAGATIDGLMENAGRAIAEEAVRHLPLPASRVAVVAGSGNNGGDGACAAHYLTQWGHRPELWLLRPAGEIRTPAARRCFERIAHKIPVHVGVPTPAELAGFPLVLDALLGTGQTGTPRGPAAAAIEAINASGAPVLSLDVPSGLGSEVAVRPRWTVTLTSPKEGLDAGSAGEVVVREIGIPEVAARRVGPGEFLLYPIPPGAPREGRLIVLAGGPYAGAPALTALAALRAGAERSTVVCPTEIVHDVRACGPDLVVVGIGTGAFRPEDVPALRRFLEATRHGALAIGMGAGREPPTVAAYTELLTGLDPGERVVVDADALEAALSASGKGPRPWVLTPNAGETLRLTHAKETAPEEERWAALERLAADHGLTFLAKGPRDLVTDGHRSFENAEHHPAATVAGAGDVLSGVTGGLLSAGAPPLEAARLASYWVGVAGLAAARHRAYGLIASDLLEEIPRALLEGLRRVDRPVERPG
jgi:hydroxyethylthiazole kinase-like uncharacterized protein yjeF